MGHAAADFLNYLLRAAGARGVGEWMRATFDNPLGVLLLVFATFAILLLAWAIGGGARREAEDHGPVGVIISTMAGLLALAFWVALALIFLAAGIWAFRYLFG